MTSSLPIAPPRRSGGARHIGSCLAIVATILMTSACVRNSVEEIPLSEVTETVYDTAVVIIGISAEAGIENQPVSVKLVRRDPRTMQLDADCWVYDRIAIHATAPSEGVRYLAFRVPASYYGPVFGYTFFDAAPGALIYIGDIIRIKRTHASVFRHGPSTYTSFEQHIDTTEARIALARAALQSADNLTVANWQRTDINALELICVP